MNASLLRRIAFAVLTIVAITTAAIAVPPPPGPGRRMDRGVLRQSVAERPARADPHRSGDQLRLGRRLARPQIPPDNFSVRWTRTLSFDAGRYRFTTTPMTACASSWTGN